MKKCPFCKKLITKTATKCHYCKMILSESIGIIKSKKVKNKNPFKDLNNFYNKLIKISINLISFKRKITFGYLIWITIGIFFLFNILKNKTSNSHIPIEINKPVPVIKNEEIPLKENYNRLENGKIILNKLDNSGYGALEISNGTEYDAIARLTYFNSNSSLFAVFIRANSVYKIENIPNGNYSLSFHLGKDIDLSKYRFIYKPSFSKFDESFEFFTNETAEGIKYRTYSITLNPVINGTAKTHEIDETEFNLNK